MYTKVDTKFDNLSKVFAQLNDDDQNKVVELVCQLTKAHKSIKDGSVKTTTTKRKTVKKSKTK